MPTKKKLSPIKSEAVVHFRLMLRLLGFSQLGKFVTECSTLEHNGTIRVSINTLTTAQEAMHISGSIVLKIQDRQWRLYSKSSIVFDGKRVVFSFNYQEGTYTIRRFSPKLIERAIVSIPPHERQVFVHLPNLQWVEA